MSGNHNSHRAYDRAFSDHQARSYATLAEAAQTLDECTFFREVERLWRYREEADQPALQPEQVLPLAG